MKPVNALSPLIDVFSPQEFAAVHAALYFRLEFLRRAIPELESRHQLEYDSSASELRLEQTDTKTALARLDSLCAIADDVKDLLYVASAQAIDFAIEEL